MVILLCGGDKSTQRQDIKRAQQLGFTLSEILTLLTLSSDHCSDVKELAQSKLALIQSKIIALKQLEESLTGLIGECRRNPGEARCPVIQALVSKETI